MHGAAAAGQDGGVEEVGRNAGQGTRQGIQEAQVKLEIEGGSSQKLLVTSPDLRDLCELYEIKLYSFAPMTETGSWKLRSSS